MGPRLTRLSCPRDTRHLVDSLQCPLLDRSFYFPKFPTANKLPRQLTVYFLQIQVDDINSWPPDHPV